MLKKPLVIASIIGASLFLAACSTTSDSTVPPKVSGPDEFIDAAAKAMFEKATKVYKTEYFAIGIPQGWTALSFADDQLASHISVEKDDKSAIVTIRVEKAQRATIEDTCKLVMAGVEANEITYDNRPGVQNGTCIINGHEGESPVTVWVRQYRDDNSAYSIVFSGEPATVNELLSNLVGNEKLMALMVQPL